jgi:hypothetical protein
VRGDLVLRPEHLELAEEVFVADVEPSDTSWFPWCDALLLTGFEHMAVRMALHLVERNVRTATHDLEELVRGWFVVHIQGNLLDRRFEVAAR